MKFAELIAQSHSPEAAKQYRTVVLTDSDKAALAEIGKRLLDDLSNPVPGACVLMSAMYADRLRSAISAPVYVVAGTLDIKGIRVFGDDRRFDGNSVFSQSNLEWDGHAWIVVGHYLADVSIFRTAYSPVSPPLLATYIREEFGARTGLLIDRWKNAPKYGLYYAPRYVLTTTQVEVLARSAEVVFLER